jgi:hypothetical protein
MATNILSAAEAAIVLRCAVTDADMLALLPMVDAYVKNATGRDWAQENPIRPEAKSAARILLVRAHEDPGAMAQPAPALGWGLAASLTQLEALALSYIKIEGLPSSGYIHFHGACEGDRVASVTGLTAPYTGDQAALFESTISYSHFIQQVADVDLDECFFSVLLTPLAEQQ